MRERHPGAEYPPITDEQLLADPSLWIQYRDENVVRVKSGEPVLMLRNPKGSSDMEPGLVRDYYAGGEYIGYIECDGDAALYIPYRRAEGDEHGPQRLGDDVLRSLGEAEKILRNYAEEAVLNPK